MFLGRCSALHLAGSMAKLTCALALVAVKRKIVAECMWLLSLFDLRALLLHKVQFEKATSTHLHVGSEVTSNLFLLILITNA